MATEHERWIVDMFGALNQNQMTLPSDLLGRLKQHLRLEKEGQA